MVGVFDRTSASVVSEIGAKKKATWLMVITVTLTINAVNNVPLHLAVVTSPIMGPFVHLTNFQTHQIARICRPYWKSVLFTTIECFLPSNESLHFHSDYFIVRFVCVLSLHYCQFEHYAFFIRFDWISIIRQIFFLSFFFSFFLSFFNRKYDFYANENKNTNKMYQIKLNNAVARLNLVHHVASTCTNVQVNALSTSICAISTVRKHFISIMRGKS